MAEQTNLRIEVKHTRKARYTVTRVDTGLQVVVNAEQPATLAVAQVGKLGLTRDEQMAALMVVCHDHPAGQAQALGVPYSEL